MENAFSWSTPTPNDKYCLNWRLINKENYQTTITDGKQPFLEGDIWQPRLRGYLVVTMLLALTYVIISFTKSNIADKDVEI